MRAAHAAVLDINNIEVVYNKAVQVLRGLSLSVPAGSIVALLGSNGAGKSTTLKAVSGLLDLEDGALVRGRIVFDGGDTAGARPQNLVRAGLAHVMEGRRVFEDLTVEENLVAATYALTGRAGARADFDLVYTYFPRLFERRRGLAGYLSGGEQQMLAIGRALIAQPRLMLLVEQNASVALAVANYGYIMETGKVVIDGSADKLAADPDVREFYLGVGGGGEARGFRDIKHYKRRKRWLS